MKIKSFVLGIFLLVAGMSFSVQAQTEDDAIKATLNNYLNGIAKGEATLLEQAFHPTAVLKSINLSTGALEEKAVKSFIASTPAGGIEGKGGSTRLVSYSYIGTSAVATVELRFPDFKYVDLLSLLKVGNDWKIVSRVFSRTNDLNATVKGSAGTAAAAPVATPTATNKPAPKKSSTANAKPKADDGW